MLPKTLPLLNAVLVGLLVTGSSLAFAAKLPRPLADVNIDTPGAKRIRLTATKGKPRVIAILASTCEHCEDTVATLSKLERQFRVRGVQFVGALVDEQAAQLLPAFVAKTKPSFVIGTMSQDNTRRLADFGMRDHPFVPILLFVDANNMVRYQFHGDEAIFQSNTEAGLKNMIDVLLKLK